MTHFRSRQVEHSPQRAALLVDYVNLHAHLDAYLDDAEHTHGVVAAAVQEMRRYLSEEDGLALLPASAYGDFETFDRPALQQDLQRRGIEPHFVAAASPEAPAHDVDALVQLSLDAAALVRRRPSVHTVVLLTGDRPLRPLVQTLRREGAHPLVAALHPPEAARDYTDGDVFMDLRHLLPKEVRDEVPQGTQHAPQSRPPRAKASGGRSANASSGRSAPRERPPASRAAQAPPAPGSDAPAGRLGDGTLMRALEVAEEHFGQYEEVYLTPLLRKLSDVLGEDSDPKALVSGLEDAGAVRLEKRKGYPYDYTVLIVERDHPDVQAMEAKFYDGPRSTASIDDYAAGDADDDDTDDYAESDDASVAADYDFS